jgi:hypothetical protein
MGYPGFFESVLFAQKWGRDRIVPRNLTSGEQADIAILRAAHRIVDEAKEALDRLPVMQSKTAVDHSPRDISDQLGAEMALLEESIREIERVPVDEAERAEWERDE